MARFHLDRLVVEAALGIHKVKKPTFYDETQRIYHLNYQKFLIHDFIAFAGVEKKRTHDGVLVKSMEVGRILEFEYGKDGEIVAKCVMLQEADPRKVNFTYDRNIELEIKDDVDVTELPNIRKETVNLKYHVYESDKNSKVKKSLVLEDLDNLRRVGMWENEGFLVMMETHR